MFSKPNPDKAHRMQKPIIFLLVSFSMLIPGIASAKPANVTEAELQILPRYCRDTMWFPARHSQRKNYWIDVMGNTFIHMHHYCWALVNYNRSMKTGLTDGQRRSMWENILNDYLYVINNSAPDFIMQPEILTRAGQVELLLKRPNNANEAFRRARALKPDYWPAYSHWVEFLMKAGKRAEALEVVTAGLKHAPHAKVLLEQNKVLGGKPPEVSGSQGQQGESPSTPDALSSTKQDSGLEEKGQTGN